jgi:[ribosomal protein S5]-alanine N-acetyltransferase
MQVVETTRLVIRPFVMEDLADAHHLLDVDLRWSGPAVSLEERRQRLQFYRDLADWVDTGRLYGYRAVLLRRTSRLIGICGFLPCLWPPQRKALLGMVDADGGFATLELELGYALASDQRGQGYATEAVQALVDYAFRDLGIRRLVAGTGHDNARSIALLQRIGMRMARNADAEWPEVVGVVDNGRA